MTAKRVIIVTNGVLNQDFVKDIKTADFIIGVDYAAHWLIKNKITPNLAIGDFDSTTNKELIDIKKTCPDTQIFPSKKDFTDTELAVQKAIKLKPKSVEIYGAIGNRIDHTLGNILLLEKLLKHSISASIKDLNNQIYLIKKTLTLDKDKNFPYLSILPISKSINISLSGFAYNLDHKTIIRGQSIGISNQISKVKAKITLHSGTVLVVKSRD